VIAQAGYKRDAVLSAQARFTRVSRSVGSFGYTQTASGSPTEQSRRARTSSYPVNVRQGILSTTWVYTTSAHRLLLQPAPVPSRPTTDRHIALHIDEVHRFSRNLQIGRYRHLRGKPLATSAAVLRCINDEADCHCGCSPSIHARTVQDQLGRHH
jgi:hypothetical protein